MILGEAAARPENSKSAAALPKRYFLICKSFHHPFWEWNRLCSIIVMKLLYRICLYFFHYLFVIFSRPTLSSLRKAAAVRGKRGRTVSPSTLMWYNEQKGHCLRREMPLVLYAFFNVNQSSKNIRKLGDSTSCFIFYGKEPFHGLSIGSPLCTVR